MRTRHSVPVLLVVIILAGLVFGAMAIKKYRASDTTAFPSVSPTADPQAAWREHSYPEFGYSFAAPGEYVVHVNALNPAAPYILQSINLSLEGVDSRPADPGIRVLSASSLEDGIQKIVSGAASIANRKELLVNGRQWTSFNLSGSELAERETMYVTYLNGRLYVVGDASGGTNALTKDILETFRFAE